MPPRAQTIIWIDDRLLPGPNILDPLLIICYHYLKTIREFYCFLIYLTGVRLGAYSGCPLEGDVNGVAECLEGVGRGKVWKRDYIPSPD